MTPRDDAIAGSPDDEFPWAQRMAADTSAAVTPPSQTPTRELVATVGKHNDETHEEFKARAIAEIAAALKADFMRRQVTT